MDHPLKVSFAMGGKRKRHGPKLLSQPSEDDATATPNQTPDQYSESLEKATVLVAGSSDTFQPDSSAADSSIEPTSHDSSQNVTSLSAMAEPPAKRAKRTNSSTMWDRNSTRANEAEHRSRPIEDSDDRRERDRKDERSRHHGRDDRRHRSRSRDEQKRRERSYSRERDRSRHKESTRRRSRSRDRYRNGDRNDGRDRRDRKRSTSRDRHRSRRDEPPPRRADRHRSRSRSPLRSKPPPRTRTPPPVSKAPLLNPTTTTKASHSSNSKPSSTGTSSTPAPSDPASAAAVAATTTNAPPTTETDMDVDSDPDIALMRRMMGFSGFKSTKNTKVPGNNVGAVRKEKKTEYRQYMNRVGGFNRPLSPSR